MGSATLAITVGQTAKTSKAKITFLIVQGILPKTRKKLTIIQAMEVQKNSIVIKRINI